MLAKTLDALDLATQLGKHLVVRKRSTPSFTKPVVATIWKPAEFCCESGEMVEQNIFWDGLVQLICREPSLANSVTAARPGSMPSTSLR